MATLRDIEQMRGSAQLKARYVHIGKSDFRLQLVFLNGRIFQSDKSWRQKTHLEFDWRYNRYKFSEVSFSEL